MNRKIEKQPSLPKNKQLIVILAAVGILVVLGVAGRFIWRYMTANLSQKAAEELAEEAIEQSTGNEAEINVAEGQWPADLSTQLQYPGSDVEASSSYENGGQKNTTVSLMTEDNFDQVYSYYTGLTEKGWQVSYKFQSSRSDVARTASISLSQGSISAAVTVAEEEENDQISIGILVNKK